MGQIEPCEGVLEGNSREVQVCGEFADTFLRDNVAAPAYRVPSLGYSKVLPVLLGESALEHSDARALMLFYTQADSFNRGLDQAELARGDSERLGREYDRCRMKAEPVARCRSRRPVSSAGELGR